MRFQILGPLAVIHEGIDITPSAPKVRQLLAFLLIRCGTLVTATELIDELWGYKPPASAMTTVQTYVYKIRREVLHDAAVARLHSRPPGYVLEVAPQAGDMAEFERLVSRGRAALARREFRQAATALRRALALWRGPALADVVTGDILSGYLIRLEEDRLRALDLRIDVDLRLGMHRELVSELRLLAAQHPLDERFHAHLMLALYRCGRQHDALEVFSELRGALRQQLGLETSATTRQLHIRMLTSDPALADTPLDELERVPLSSGSDVQAPPVTVPCQLPPDIRDFTGRTELLEDLRDYSTLPAGGAWSRCVVLTGMPGIGKTAAALHAAHSQQSAFPDGQFFAELGGLSARPADPNTIADGFLRAAGFSDADIPVAFQERINLFRSWCARRQVLIVLDDASAEAQVAPFVPAAPRATLIITSRHSLSGLPGTSHLEVGALTLDEGIHLLDSIAGSRGGSPKAAARIVELCGRHPLALRGVASRLAAMPHWSFEKMAARLEKPRRRLDELRFADLDMRSRYQASYSRLVPTDRSLLRLISLLPPAGFSVAKAAALVGDSPDAVETRLSRLTGLHLLEARESGTTDEIRYRFHELGLLFAREELERELLGGELEPLGSPAESTPRSSVSVRHPSLRASSAAAYVMI